MKPKEKAKNLLAKFDFIPVNNGYSYKDTLELRKQSALLLVNELIKENLRYDYIPFEDSRSAFYLEVEKELNKL
jgi:hypothetical protein